MAITLSEGNKMSCVIHHCRRICAALSSYMMKLRDCFVFRPTKWDGILAKTPKVDNGKNVVVSLQASRLIGARGDLRLIIMIISKCKSMPIIIALSLFVLTVLYSPKTAAAEWGYFSGGAIHIISTSHQDIAWMDSPETCA